MITRVDGIRVGHHTDRTGITGSTVVLCPPGTSGSCDVKGGAPGTRETDAIRPGTITPEVHGVVLSGGSAFGLAAADGVVRFLEEKGIGLDVGVARIPLVSAAVLFDVVFGDPTVRPDAQMGYKAASSAASGDFAQGSAGAGAGATVGKVLGPDHAMKGGLGSASVRLEGDLVVGALAAVNAFGEVRDPWTRKVIAGPRLEDGSLGDTVELLPEVADRLRWGESTTLGIVATNARLTKPQANKVAQMGHDGLARAIYPVHTTVDGDIVFAAGTGEVEAAPDIVGAWGARVIEEAIVRAVLAAEGSNGIPAARDL
jgi:L-aminopeptidase/D-esterase-like protein